MLIPFGKILIAPGRDGSFGGVDLVGHARRRGNYPWRNEMTSDHFSFAAATFARGRVTLSRYESEINFPARSDAGGGASIRAGPPGAAAHRQARATISNGAPGPLGQIE